MSMKEYSLKFTQLDRYAPYVLANNRSRMRKFVSGVSDSMVKEYRTIIMIKEMDLASLMAHAQQIEEEKINKIERENKRARIGSSNFTQSRSEGGNHPQLHQKSIVSAPSSASAPIP